jgi:hypothetical protein
VERGVIFSCIGGSMNFVKRILGLKKQPSPIIVVSGLPRSGTSLMMSMLKAGGLSLLVDEIRTADENNPRGYYEYQKVKKLEKGESTWLSKAEGKAVKVIAPLLRHLPDQFRYHVIFMRREMEEIVVSQKKMRAGITADADQAEVENLISLQEKYLNEILKWLEQQPNFTVKEIFYNKLIIDPEQELQDLKEFLDSSLELDAMTAKIDPSLYRQRVE